MEQSVFRRLLGNDLDSVHGILRDFSDHPRGAKGVLSVKHHTGRMARFFIWLLKLPKEGTDLITTVQVKQANGMEFWRRRIGPSRLRTRHAVKDHWLEERANLFKFLHKVSVVDGALHYEQARVYFLGIRLPYTLSPIIHAVAKGDEKGWHLNLVVSCPRCGAICEYEGWIEPV